jgi:hypothetical protein
MYEIWLGLNILHELLLPVLPVVAVLGLLWLVLTLKIARSPLARWRHTLPATVIGGLMITALAFVLLPIATQSGLGELRYWVDWAFLLGMSMVAGAIAAAVLWPLLAWLGRRAA